VCCMYCAPLHTRGSILKRADDASTQYYCSQETSINTQRGRRLAFTIMAKRQEGSLTCSRCMHRKVTSRRRVNGALRVLGDIGVCEDACPASCLGFFAKFTVALCGSATGPHRIDPCPDFGPCAVGAPAPQGTLTINATMPNPT
jgi:hypothetical protein